MLGSAETSPAAVPLSLPAAHDRDARRILDLQEIRNDLKLYFDTCNVYPGGGILPRSAPLKCGVPDTQPPTNPYVAMQGVTGSWGISSIPQDPLLNYNYGYCSDPSGSRYTLRAALEGPKGQTLQFMQTDNCMGMLSCGGPNDYCIGP